MLRRLLLTALASLTVNAAPSFAAAAPAPTLRVLSFNVWGIWVITPSRQARIAAIGPAVAAFEPDLVALQEVWLDEDAAVLAQAFRAAGLPHTRRFSSTWPGDSGLMIASRHPISKTEFIEYDEGTHPSVPWHVDWMAGKGIARVRVETPAGPVDFANTHVQANYGGTGGYELVQLAQLLQAGEFLDSPRDVPLVVAGDLNVPCDSYVYRAFSLRAGLTPTDPKCRIDSVSVRAGPDRALRTLRVQDVLTEDFDLEDGARRPLSDHPAVLADLEITEAPTIAGALAAASPAPPAAAWMALARETLPRVQQKRRFLSQGQMQDGLLSFVLLQLALLLYVVRTGRLRRLRAPRWAPMGLLVVGAALAAGWFAYLGLSYAPKHLAELEGTKTRLEAPLQLGFQTSSLPEVARSAR